MADYQTANMNLASQSVAGRREWRYEDTGPVADVVASGFVADAKAKGMKVGDYVNYYDTAADVWYGLQCTVVQDTGGTTGTLDGQVIIADTS